MKAIKFACNLEDLVAVALSAGYAAREYKVQPAMQTDGIGFNFSVTVSFGSIQDSYRAIQFLKLITDKKNISSCEITI